jgi:hypothetical protein
MAHWTVMVVLPSPGLRAVLVAPLTLSQMIVVVFS